MERPFSSRQTTISCGVSAARMRLPSSSTRRATGRAGSESRMMVSVIRLQRESRSM